MKKIWMFYKFCIKVLRTFPLYFLLKLKTRFLHDNYAELYYKDIMNFKNLNFFSVLVYRPHYIMILYHRLGEISTPFRWWCGMYPTFSIQNRNETKIDGGLNIEHPHGTFLNAAKIGENFTCRHNATLGCNRGGRPIIGDNVELGCGACILGNIKVGNNVIIGANCVVTKDVPDNCVVVGCPAYIIRQNGRKVNIKL